jgi:hypothetical protein
VSCPSRDVLDLLLGQVTVAGKCRGVGVDPRLASRGEVYSRPACPTQVALVALSNEGCQTLEIMGRNPP